MTRQPENSPNPQASSQDRGVLDEALEPGQIRSLNSALRKLSETDAVGKDMEDAAKRLLSGRLALRDALEDPAVARALGGGMASLRGKWDALSEEEREQLIHEGAGESGNPSSGPSEPSGPRRSESEDSRSGTQSPGRHSGGFSLY
ncbi:hypothetical protein ACFYO2_21485 [Streptomyces sp. NPDC006602]|uniref:hypothetical protein n=1 Tax=Streptomyces sp. NPDC006602 TaxID=3364751 RepID=UPI003682ECB2